MPSNTPSPSESCGQPFASTVAPAGVSGHLSSVSGTPSPSESRTDAAVGAASGQPLSSTLVPAGVLGHWSMPSSTPSPSESCGQPLASTVAPSGVLGQASSLSGTPSRSLSSAPAGPFVRVSGWKKENPADATRWVALLLAPGNAL